jgi:hypothetical protein
MPRNVYTILRRLIGAATGITDIEKWFAEEIAKTFGGIIGMVKPE